MAEKPRSCVKCGGLLEAADGPGRPATYCSTTCRRLAEFEIRRIDRRLAAYELERRELKAEGPDPCDDDARQRRLRALRKWAAADERRLRELVGIGQNNQKAAA